MPGVMSLEGRGGSVEKEKEFERGIGEQKRRQRSKNVLFLSACPPFFTSHTCTVLYSEVLLLFMDFVLSLLSLSLSSLNPFLSCLI